METFDEKFTSQTLPLASTQHAMTMDVLMYQKWRKKKSLRDSERQERSWDTSDTRNLIEWKLIKLKANRKLFLESLCKHSPSTDKVFTWSQTSSKLVSCSAFLLHTALLESLKHSTAFSLIAKTNKLLREMHCSFYFTLFIEFNMLVVRVASTLVVIPDCEAAIVPLKQL